MLKRLCTTSIYPKIASLGMLSLLLTSSILAISLSFNSIVSADTLNYPWPTDTEAPCEFAPNGGSSCTNPNNSYDLYDWGVYISGTFHQYRNGYEYRNCTDYTQWKESTSPINVSVPGNWGNGGQWYDSAPTSEETTTPKTWDAAVVPGNPGHVAFVESVNTNGTITISEYNHDAQGHGDTRTGNASSMGFTEFVDFGVHPTNPPPPLTLRIGMVDNSNTFWVKENTVGALWDNENTGVSQGLVSGSLIADLVGGTFQVKQGTIGALWDNEDTGITQGAISDATAPAPLRIGVLTSAGHFLVKEGSLGGTWDDEYPGVVAGYVSGSRIGVLTNTGSFLVKDGGLGATRVDEYDGVSQGVLSGSLVGAVTTGGLFPSGTYIVKQGDLGQPWVNEYPNVSSGTLSDATSSTPLRIGALTTSGAYWVKEGGLGATFINEYNSVSQGMLSGNLIGVLSGGTYLVKQGTTGATFINEQTSVVTSGTLWSTN